MANIFAVLVRDDDFQIISHTQDSDPLHGYGSWNLHSDGYASWIDAWNGLNMISGPTPEQIEDEEAMAEENALTQWGDARREAIKFGTQL